MIYYTFCYFCTMKHFKYCILFLPIVLLRCAGSKPADFVGVYEFRTLSNYVILDTSIMIDGLLGSEPLMITKRKLAPLKIDIFKNGDQLAGQITITVAQKYDRQKGLQNITNDDKMQLNNVHVVNDTLVFDLPKGVALKGLKTNSRSLKLVPANGGSLIVYSDEIDLAETNCSTFLEVKGSTIVLHGIREGNTADLVKQADDCLSEISFQKHKGKHGAGKDEHLRNLLFQ